MRQCVLFRIACDPVVRISSAVRNFRIPADIVEPEPALYLGGGAIVDVPEVQQLINGTADRLRITLSGVSALTQRLATEEAAEVKGAKVHIGFVFFDADWQVDEVEWESVFRADALTVSNEPSAKGRTRSITLSIGTDDTERSRAPMAFWTDADQRRRSPTDRFFDHIAGLSAGTSRPFGPT